MRPLLAMLRNGWVPLMWLLLLLVAVFSMDQFEGFFRQIEPDARAVIYQRSSFAQLLGKHLLIVGAASLVSVIVGVAAGILATRRWGRDFLPLVSQVASIGQTFPPVAVLALAVPLLGFGSLPTIFALVLYGLLPVLRNTLAGLQDVSPTVIEAARGIGMSPLQSLFKVELPLASVVILAGIRTSVTVAIATAAIGSTIGASTLGDPVIAGLVNGNTAYVLQGAILIGLLAVLIDSMFECVQQWFAVQQGRAQ
ncbi:glycine betaine ABC transporter membrane subunit YehW [Pseudomonas marincola]|uniref:Putative transporter subunit: permease component of ABC superfamily transporter n=2 Tax=Pseudomonas marincola TaxID=437900 RepID=A0A653E5W7_9PSED|nr:glycine betaine ABC transporter membrane subunit YehW [Pseudomonas marincola]